MQDVPTAIIFSLDIRRYPRDSYCSFFFFHCKTAKRVFVFASLPVPPSFSLVIRNVYIFVSSPLFPSLFLYYSRVQILQWCSRAVAFTVQTFYFLTSSAKVTYAPGYESLCTIREKLNSMRRFR